MATLGCAAPAAATLRTQWSVRDSEGFDALALLGPLSGKPFYARYYERELAAFRPRLAPDALDALSSLYADADAAGYLLWPQAALICSGGPDASLDALIAALDAADTTLRAPFEASVYWDAQDWRQFADARPRLLRVLHGLRDARFGEFRREQIAARFVPRQQELQALFARFDVIREQERLLGRALDARIEVNLLWFCRPHGVKVQGQRFLAHLQSSDDVLLLTAAHEILHPPFDPDGTAARTCLAVLERDPLLARILREKSKDSGYNSLAGILDEDTAQALDQIIQERFGVGRPAVQRWATSDEGMHVFAAGLYGLLKADGFDRRGGAIESWLAQAAASGRLAPASLHAAAAAVLQRPVDQLWVTPR